MSTPPAKKSRRENPYQSIQLKAVPRTGRPGSPHSFFQASFSFPNGLLEQRLHKHANGLVVVTIGTQLPPAPVDGVEYVIPAPPETNAAMRRKYQGKLLKGKSVEGSVQPNDVLAELVCGNERIPIRSGVLGMVIERNDRLQEKLVEDPLFDGYVAVIQPAGPFPPKVER